MPDFFFKFQKLLKEKQAQKLTLFRKLEAHRMSREQHDYEALAARQLLQQAKDQVKQLEATVAGETGKQANTVALICSTYFLLLLKSLTAYFYEFVYQIYYIFADVSSYQ
jgi:hypothetical protein